MTAPAAGGAPTVVTVHVTAQDTIATQDYTIVVSRAVVASFPLSADALCVPTGNVSGEQTMSSGLTYGFATYANFWDATGPTTVVVTPDSTSVQKFAVTTSAETAGTWVQFAVSTSPGKTLTVSKVSVFGGSGGGSYTNYKVRYCTNVACDWTAPATELTDLAMTGALVKNSMYWKAAATSITVNPGETLYLRVFPWISSGSTSGKSLLLQSFKVDGSVQ
jgi:hypothetical protein